MSRRKVDLGSHFMKNILTIQKDRASDRPPRTSSRSNKRKIPSDLPEVPRKKRKGRGFNMKHSNGRIRKGRGFMDIEEDESELFGSIESLDQEFSPSRKKPSEKFLKRQQKFNYSSESKIKRRSIEIPNHNEEKMFNQTKATQNKKHEKEGEITSQMKKEARRKRFAMEIESMDSTNSTSFQTSPKLVKKKIRKPKKETPVDAKKKKPIATVREIDPPKETKSEDLDDEKIEELLNAAKWGKAEPDGDNRSLSGIGNKKTRRKKQEQIFYQPRQRISKNLDQSWGGDVLYEAMTYPECRGIALLLEDELTHFVNTHDLDSVLLFPVMNSYHRMLLHKIAERFHLKSFSDGLYQERRARVKHTKDCKIPLVGLSDWVIRSERRLCVQQLSKYKELGRRRPTEKISHIEMKCGEETELRVFEKAVRPIYKWEFISPQEEDYWKKHKEEVQEDLSINKVGVEHIIEATFQQEKTPEEMKTQIELICDSIDKECEMIYVHPTACVVLLEDKKKVMDAVRASTKLKGCRLVPFMNAGREVKKKCGFPVQRKRQKKDMAVTHRILGRALGIRNFGATIDAKKPRTALSPKRD